LQQGACPNRLSFVPTCNPTTFAHARKHDSEQLISKDWTQINFSASRNEVGMGALGKSVQQHQATVPGQGGRAQGPAGHKLIRSLLR